MFNLFQHVALLSKSQLYLQIPLSIEMKMQKKSYFNAWGPWLGSDAPQTRHKAEASPIARFNAF
jgi:hypothetical protein